MAKTSIDPWMVNKRKKRKNGKRYKKTEKDRRQRQSSGENIFTLTHMNYMSYLNQPHWKKTARRRRKLSGNRCDKCGANGCILEVHHLTYKRLGRERMSDLMTLCSECHDKVHNRHR